MARTTRTRRNTAAKAETAAQKQAPEQEQEQEQAQAQEQAQEGGTSESPSPELDKAMADEICGYADAVVTFNDSDAGKHVQEVLATDQVIMVVENYPSDSTYMAEHTTDDDQDFRSELLGTEDKPQRHKTVKSAVASILRQLDSALAQVNFDNAIGNIEYDQPAIGGNRPQDVDPWEDDAPNEEGRERLRSLGAEIGEDVRQAEKSTAETRKRWLHSAALIDEAANMIAALSVGGKGGLDKHRWGRYVERFFPQFNKLGKNALSETRELGAAPGKVTNLWPDTQSTPKAFQGWANSHRKIIASTAADLIMHDTAEALHAWAQNDNEGETPAAPGREAIRAVIASGAILEKLEKLKQGQITNASNNRMAAAKSKAGSADYKKAIEAALANEAREVEYRNAIAIAEWKLVDLPEDGDRFDKNPMVKAIRNAVNALYQEKLHDAQPDLVTAEKTKAAVDASIKEAKFAEKDADEAARHLFNILVAHPEPESVMGVMEQLLERYRDEEAKNAANETAADASLDGGAAASDDVIDEEEDEEGEQAAE